MFQNQYVYLQIKNKFPTSSKTISNFRTPVVFKTTINRWKWSNNEEHVMKYIWWNERISKKAVWDCPYLDEFILQFLHLVFVHLNVTWVCLQRLFECSCKSKRCTNPITHNALHVLPTIPLTFMSSFWSCWTRSL